MGTHFGPISMYLSRHISTRSDECKISKLLSCVRALNFQILTFSINKFPNNNVACSIDGIKENRNEKKMIYIITVISLTWLGLA